MDWFYLVGLWTIYDLVYQRRYILGSLVSIIASSALLACAAGCELNSLPSVRP